MMVYYSFIRSFRARVGHRTVALSTTSRLQNVIVSAITWEKWAEKSFPSKSQLQNSNYKFYIFRNDLVSKLGAYTLLH